MGKKHISLEKYQPEAVRYAGARVLEKSANVSFKNFCLGTVLLLLSHFKPLLDWFHEDLPQHGTTIAGLIIIGQAGAQAVAAWVAKK